MKIHPTLPAASALAGEGQKYDYVDCCSTPLHRSDATATEAVTAFFNASPKWLTALFKLRNTIVGMLGLKTGAADPSQFRPPYRVGEQFGLFKLMALNQTEAIMGEDDIHLNFRTSFLISADTLTLSTAVQFNNIWGRLYFFVIKPFHRMMMYAMAENMAAHIDNSRTNT